MKFWFGLWLGAAVVILGFLLFPPPAVVAAQQQPFNVYETEYHCVFVAGYANPSIAVMPIVKIITADGVRTGC